MAISYPLSTPTSIGVESIELRAANSVAVSQSPFTYKQQVVNHGGQKWSASVSIPPLQKEFVEPWVAFLLALRGQTGTFLLGDPNNTVPRGQAKTFLGVPVVSSVTNGTVSMTGASTSKVGWLKAGDYIQLGTGASSTLHKVLLDVDTNSSGAASIEIWPYPRTSVASGTTIKVTDTKGLFRLASNEQSWSIGSSSQYGLQFECVEVI